MAISRAQLLKELLPGLNALFGLEYQKYEDEHAEIYDVENSERSFEEEVKLSGFGQHQSSKREQLYLMIQLKSLSLLDITMKLLQWDFLLLKKQWKIICMTRFQQDIQKH
jgi:hypothetical protein